MARAGDSVLTHVVAETGQGLVARFVRLTLIGSLDGQGVPEADIQYATGATNWRGEATPTTSTLSRSEDESYIHVLSTSGLIHVEVFDTSGTRLANRHVGANVLVFTGKNGPANGATVWPGMTDLLELILATPELDALLMDVAKRPPLWALLNGIQLTLDLGVDDLEDLGGGRIRHSATIAADGYRALEGTVEQGPKSFPFLLTAGIQRLEATHPGREDRRATISVVASVRGSGPPLIDEAKGPFPAPDRVGRVPGYEPAPPDYPNTFEGSLSRSR